MWEAKVFAMADAYTYAEATQQLKTRALTITEKRNRLTVQP